MPVPVSKVVFKQDGGGFGLASGTCHWTPYINGLPVSVIGKFTNRSQRLRFTETHYPGATLVEVTRSELLAQQRANSSN